MVAQKSRPGEKAASPANDLYNPTAYMFPTPGHFAPLRRKHVRANPTLSEASLRAVCNDLAAQGFDLEYIEYHYGVKRANS
ncbi:MAG: hypothetical protein JWN80_1392 [Microbacteriaceae bacterium]|nr:hypothetical protein [Microbacteriaceae bacterium]